MAAVSIVAAAPTAGLGWGRMSRWETCGASMREIGSPLRITIFLYAAGILAAVFVLDTLGFSSNAILGVACLLAIAGVSIMVWHFLRANSH